jgi:large subunit ribosomal protein L25
MREITLNAEIGRAFGSRNSKRLRREDLIPGVVYGKGGDPVAISVTRPDLRAALHTEAGANAVIRLNYDGKQDLVLIKDLQRHPVRRTVSHVDFKRVLADEKIKVEVPLIIEGEAPKVAAEYGMTEQVLNSIVLVTTPLHIPTEVKINIADLEIGKFITVGDLPLPEGITTEANPEAIVVAGRATRATIQATTAAAPAAAAAAKAKK